MGLKILLTGGIGDILAIESHFSDQERKDLEIIYYATRAWNEASRLWINCPPYKTRVPHILVFKAFNRQLPCFLRIEQVRTRRDLMHPLPSDVQDYSISQKFPEIETKKIPYNGSSFVKYQMADISHFALPEKYAVIVPYTAADFRTTSKRNFDSFEWGWVLSQVSIGFKGVVINPHPKLSVPEHPYLINLTGKTNIMESIEITKKASMYIGVDSALSVIATKIIPKENIIVKNGEGGHLRRYCAIYYAPLTEFDFIKRHLVIPTPT